MARRNAQPSDAVIARIRARRKLAQERGESRKPRANIPTARWPSGARMAYLLHLRRVTDKIEQLVRERWVKRLPDLLEQARHERDRAIRLDAAADGAAAFDPAVIVDEIEKAFSLRAIAREVGGETSAHNKTELNRQFKAGLGFDLLQDEPYLADRLDLFAADNAKLVRDLSSEAAEKLRAIIVRAVREAKDLRTVQKQIEERIGITRRRAALLARDQVGSLNAELTQLRHERAGVAEYEWQTVGDDRVRPGHRDLRGSRQRYDKPPVVDPRTGRRAHPGQDINCRCVATPVLEGLRAALTAA